MKLITYLIYTIFIVALSAYLTHGLLELSGKPVTGNEYDRVMERINNTQ